MAIRVKELRLSLIWNKSFYKDTNLPLLADRERYAAAFEKARTGDEATGPWLLPWFGDHRQHFWEFYLQPVAPSNFQSVSAANARDYFVPLRIPPSANAVARDGTIATLEGFCYPYNVGVLATVHVRPSAPLALADMVDAAIAARNADFQMTWKDKQPATHGALQSLADKIVERVHAIALSDPSAKGKALPNPSTIATVIDAEITADQAGGPTPPGPSVKPEGAQPNSAGAAVEPVISDGAMLARALTALCNLVPGWKNSGGGEPVEAFDPERPQWVAVERGRAVWLRTHFSDVEVKGRKTAIGCYHRNLALAILQTSALTALLTRANDVLSDPKGKLLLLQRDDVVRAIGLLNKLRAGDYSTYRSWVLQHQVDAYVERIQKLTQQLGL